MIIALARLLGIDTALVKAVLFAGGLLVAALAYQHWKSGVVEDAFKTEDNDQLKERGKTDAEIDDLDDAALCRELGGVQCDD